MNFMFKIQWMSFLDEMDVLLIIGELLIRLFLLLGLNFVLL